MRALLAVALALTLPTGTAWAQSEAEDLAPENEAPKPKPKPSSSSSKPSSSKSSKSSSSSSTSSAKSDTPSNQPVVYQAAGASSSPGGRQFGLGLQLGYPTALTFKYMLQQDQGLAGGIGAFSGFAYNSGSFTLYCDYVFHPHLLTAGDAFALTWYVGGGGQLIVNGNQRFQRPTFPHLQYYSFFSAPFWLAVRVPVGVNIALTQQPFEIYLEAVPGILIFPGLSFGIGASLGGRFYF